MRIASVTYAITKQVRQYEPVRVEVCVESTGSDDDTPQAMIEVARNIAEDAVIQAVQRGPVF